MEAFFLAHPAGRLARPSLKSVAPVLLGGVMLAQPFWGSYSGRKAGMPTHTPLPWSVAASSAAPAAVGRPLSEPGGLRDGIDGNRSDQKAEQFLERAPA